MFPQDVIRGEPNNESISAQSFSGNRSLEGNGCVAAAKIVCFSHEVFEKLDKLMNDRNVSGAIVCRLCKLF